MLFGGVGGAVVSPEALRALAEGFEAVAGMDVIPTMGAGQDADQACSYYTDYRVEQKNGARLGEYFYPVTASPGRPCRAGYFHG